jgi:hypothetical protein
MARAEAERAQDEARRSAEQAEAACSAPAAPRPAPARHVSAQLGRSPSPPPAAAAPAAAPPPRPASPVPSEVHSPPPPQRLFRLERPHELGGHERAGVVSRFPHRLEAMRDARRELEAELEEELAAELGALGVAAPAARGVGLGRAEYAAAAAALRARRAEARAAMGGADRARAEFMRATVAGHVEAAAAAAQAASCCAAGEVEDAGWRPLTGAAPPAGPPQLPALRAGDPGAFYGPLRRGTSASSIELQAQPVPLAAA